MRMPWRRSRAPQLAQGGAQLRDAQRAVRQAQGALERSQGQAGEVQALTHTLRRLREVNHFSERVAAMLRAEGRSHG